MLREVTYRQLYGILFFVLLFILFLFLRFWHIPQSIGLGSDQGRDFLTTWNIYASHKLTLIGPPSEFTVFGHEFFFGPLPFYEILPALIVGNGSIVFVSYYLTIINALGIFAALFILYRFAPNKFVVFIFGYFLTLTPLLVEYTRSYWNPFPMIVISTLLISLLSVIAYQKKTKHLFLLFFLVGVLFGLGLQAHYSYVLTITVSAIVLYVMKKINRRSTLMTLVGFIVGFSPIILFELRNHFYNLTTFILTLQHGTSLTFHSVLPQFYFISLIPFFLFLLSLFIVRITTNKNMLVLVGICFIVYTYISLATILPVPTHGYDMVPGWNVPALEKTASIIQSQHPKQFNIVDQLTNDNRAMSLRYVLTVDDVVPMAVDQYPSATTLFVYTRLSVHTILTSNVWEIHSAQPMHLVKSWPIQNGIYLYELQKTKK